MRSENTGVEYGQDFFKRCLRSLADELDLSGAKIDRLDLLDHHEPGQVSIRSQNLDRDGSGSDN
jgi:hypothetical protein